jgi:hypothetical protein
MSTNVIFENELKEILDFIKSLKKIPVEQTAISLGDIPIVDSNGETLGSVKLDRFQPGGPAWAFKPGELDVES